MTENKREYREHTVEPPETYYGDPVGAIEIGVRLGLEPRSVHMIGRRGNLPKPDYESVNNARAWEWSTVLWWAGETDRLRAPELVEQYEEMFGFPPPAKSAGKTAPGASVREDQHVGVPMVPSR